MLVNSVGREAAESGFDHKRKADESMPVAKGDERRGAVAKRRQSHRAGVFLSVLHRCYILKILVGTQKKHPQGGAFLLVPTERLELPTH